jgi:signal transduction histidine kinase
MDHGIGFDADGAMKTHGLGLISMQERLNLINGKFSIESRPGAGTTIRARVPLAGTEATGNSVRASAQLRKSG